MIVIAESRLFGRPFYFYVKNEKNRPEGRLEVERDLEGTEFAMVDFVHAARIFYHTGRT
jgi:hypothetical protein